MGKISYITITLAFLILKTSETLQMEWNIVFLPIFVLLVMSALKWILKTMFAGVMLRLTSWLQSLDKK